MEISRASRSDGAGREGRRRPGADEHRRGVGQAEIEQAPARTISTEDTRIQRRGQGQRPRPNGERVQQEIAGESLARQQTDILPDTEQGQIQIQLRRRQRAPGTRVRILNEEACSETGRRSVRDDIRPHGHDGIPVRTPTLRALIGHGVADHGEVGRTRRRGEAVDSGDDQRARIIRGGKITQD